MNNITALDSRYYTKVSELAKHLSDSALNCYRVMVEVEWLIFLSRLEGCPYPKKLPAEREADLRRIYQSFSEADYKEIRGIERETNHDVKAVEYFVARKLTGLGLEGLTGMVHFGCTSEDINNVSYALMLRDSRQQVMLPAAQLLIDKIGSLAEAFRGCAMMARTHGQPASPTTMGKELYNFYVRLNRQFEQISTQPILAKFNGAVGNFNAHSFAVPSIDWRDASRNFLSGLGLIDNPATTQIEPHDWLAEYSHCWSRWNTVLIGLCRDIWGYISLGAFRQKAIEGQTGSSTMPHKVNPIDFENAEGNLGLANALLSHMAEKLPISRWQRDLTDSTVMRNWGAVFGYTLLALKSASAGLGKLEIDSPRLLSELDAHPELLAEAIQTQMRILGISDAYEQLKQLTRGKAIDQSLLKQFIEGLAIPEQHKAKLLAAKPSNYLGYATQFPRIPLRE